VEVFVHGALCVAYSGQCLTSEALGQRSANRGECAQACRMPYELICDGKPVPLGDRRYLLSPQDLAALPVLPELIGAGVASLKIEGRLKSPEYVAAITRAYRSALDEIFAQIDRGEETVSAKALWEQSRYDLEMAFSRGLHTGWLGGIDNQRLVSARFAKKRGVFLGIVERVRREEIVLKLQAPLKAGDGVVFDAGRPDEPEQGGRVHEVEEISGNAGWRVVRFGRGHIDFKCVEPGNKLWKTSDPEMQRRLRRTFSSPTPNFRRPICLEVHGKAGQALSLIGRDERGHVVQVDSLMPLVQAQKQPLTSRGLEGYLGRLGGTGFRLETLKNHLEGAVILPAGQLNRMRREMVRRLEALRAAPKKWQLNPPAPPSHGLQQGPYRAAVGTSPEIHLAVLARTLEQLEAAIKSNATTVYCEFEDPRKYRQAVGCFRALQSQSGQSDWQILAAPPRIFKTGEEWILKQVRSCEADGYLVRNYDQLNYFQDCFCVGDFSLNIANEWSAEYFKNRFQLQRLTASYDLNIEQLDALLRAVPPQWVEITIHQHMPMFHMEHCLYCAFLSSGTDYRDCGRPCDKHQVRLRDRVGLAHPLRADAGCRNTVFNGRAQTGAEYVQKLLKRGARWFRLEFLDESAQEVKRTISKYRSLLAGEISGADLWKELKLDHQLGLTRGPLKPNED
jgi:putative protease